MRYLLLIFITSIAFTLNASEKKGYHSSYAGQEKRAIKSLSADAIQQLQQGKGWGLAKAAELNGMPGPVHILEMKKEIDLTTEQETKINALFKEMKSQAIPLGKQLIALEKDLNDSFAEETITDESLKQILSKIANVRKELRYVHLATHLQTPKILNPEQISLYNKLRGYGSGDPCKNIPAGHNVKMWKMHNDCN